MRGKETGISFDPKVCSRQFLGKLFDAVLEDPTKGLIAKRDGLPSVVIHQRIDPFSDPTLNRDNLRLATIAHLEKAERIVPVILSTTISS